MRTIKWDTEVLIVGAGPTGLTAAIELARLGIQFRIVEKRSQRSIHSKALGIQSGTLEALNKQWSSSFTDLLVAKGFKVQEATLHIYREKEVHVHFGDISSSFPYILVLPQSETERQMEEWLQKNFSLKWTERQNF